MKDGVGNYRRKPISDRLMSSIIRRASWKTIAPHVFEPFVSRDSTGTGLGFYVPGADDVMLAYQSTSFHDALYLREVLGLRPACSGSRATSITACACAAVVERLCHPFCDRLSQDTRPT